MTAKADIAIIGAGIAGLVTAVYLTRAGARVDVFESQGRVGGRLGSDVQDGFVLDRGFQVFLKGYKELTRLLDLKALDLEYFASGAYIHSLEHTAQEPVLFANPLKHPALAPGQLTTPWGTFWDKTRLGVTVALAPGDPLPSGGQPMKDWLMMQGFTQRLIDEMLRPFFSGVLLEDELVTDSRYVRYLIGQFGRHQACLPAAGMQAIANQLAAQVPSGAIWLSQAVTPEDLAGSYAHVIDTRPNEVSGPTEPRWAGTQIIYLTTTAEIEKAEWLRVSSRPGAVTNVAVPTSICPGYAPPGRHLIYVSVNRGPYDGLFDVETALRQAATMLGLGAGDLEVLDTVMFREALPLLVGLPKRSRPEAALVHKGSLGAASTLWRASDTLAYPSMNGAALSGRLTASALLTHIGAPSN